MMDKDKQPGINFDSIILVKEEFNRIPDIPATIKINLEMHSNISKDDNKSYNELTTVLTGLGDDDKEAFKLTTIFVGLFSEIIGQENFELDEFMKTNSSALMFPYIREHITTITQKSGVSPVMLAPINIMAFIKQTNTEEIA